MEGATEERGWGSECPGRQVRHYLQKWGRRGKEHVGKELIRIQVKKPEICTSLDRCWGKVVDLFRDLKKGGI